MATFEKFLKDISVADVKRAVENVQQKADQRRLRAQVQQDATKPSEAALRQQMEWGQLTAYKNLIEVLEENKE